MWTLVQGQVKIQEKAIIDSSTYSPGPLPLSRGAMSFERVAEVDPGLARAKCALG